MCPLPTPSPNTHLHPHSRPSPSCTDDVDVQSCATPRAHSFCGCCPLGQDELERLRGLLRGAIRERDQADLQVTHLEGAVDRLKKQVWQP
jgi:hypothetical protein